MICPHCRTDSTTLILINILLPRRVLAAPDPSWDTSGTSSASMGLSFATFLHLFVSFFLSNCLSIFFVFLPFHFFYVFLEFRFFFFRPCTMFLSVFNIYPVWLSILQDFYFFIFLSFRFLSFQLSDSTSLHHFAIPISHLSILQSSLSFFLVTFWSFRRKYLCINLQGIGNQKNTVYLNWGLSGLRVN